MLMKNEILDEIGGSNHPNYTKKSLLFFAFSTATIILLIVITEYFLDLLIRVGGSFIVPSTIILIGLILNIFGLLNAFRSMKSKEISNWKRNIALIGNSIIFLFYIFILWAYIDHIFDNWFL
jgi:hypothetical protein